MDINAQFIQHSNNASLPMKEHVLLLDPQTKNTAIGGSEMTTWDIPTASGSNGQYIDMNSSYLEVTVRAIGTANKTARLPVGGLHSLIETVDVESSNFVVEHTENWGRLHQVLSDVNDADEDRQGYKAFSQGLSGAISATSTSASTKAGADFGDLVVSTTTTTTAGLPERKGVSLPAVDSADTMKLCIPVPSQQMNNGKHLPVWAISKLRYSITWAKALDGVVVDDTGITGFQIDNPRLHLCYLEMSNKSKDVINSRGGLSWSHPMWETHKDNTQAGVPSQSFRYPSHKSSVKTLLCAFHHADAHNTATKKKDYCSRTNPSLTSYQYRINGEYYPQNEVDLTGGGVSGVMELERAFHKVKGNTGQISRDNYMSTDTDEAKSTFVIAVNTETNTGRSNSSFGGVSTLQESPLLLCKFGTSVATECLMCVQYDGANTIKDGIWRVDN